MLYVCIPVHNEAATVGVLLWRLRTVLQDTGRDYEVVVYDDASTDATAEVLAPYLRVLPLTVLGGPGALRRGRTGATEVLVRHVAAGSRYPRRDACVLLQGDFTDRAEDVPPLLAAFDQGADLVVGRREPGDAQPAAERRLRRMGPWVLRPLVRVDGVDDLLGGLRLARVAALRDLVRARGAAPLLTSEGWAGVAELLAAVVPFARRLAVVDTPGRYDVRSRPSRLDWAAELRALARYGWRARGMHARLGPSSPGEPSTRASATHSAPVPAPAATSGITGQDEAIRPERPRRARAGRAPRNDSVLGNVRSSNAPVEVHSGDTASETTPPRASVRERPARERPARAPRRAATEADGDSLTASADERPRAPGHERRPRQLGAERVAVTAGAAAGPDDVPSAANTLLAATSAAAPTPVGDAAIGPSAPGSDDVSDLASPDATESRPGRRRKRRARRRARSAGVTGPGDDEGLEAAEPSAGGPRLPAQAGVAADRAAEDRVSDGPLSDDPLSDDQTAGERIERLGSAAGKRRRRRRARGGSDERPSSVPPEASASDDDR